MSFISSKQAKVTREELADDTCQGIDDLASNSSRLMDLHKNFLQSNMTVTAYVNISKKMIAGLKTSVALTKTDPSEVRKVLQ